MIIILAADHAGVPLKNKIATWLGRNHAVVDIGAQNIHPDDDYPLYAREGAHAVLDTKGSIGIFVCGSGVGMAIAANKVHGIRAAQAESAATARRARVEDHANVLVLGSRIVAHEKARTIVRAFIAARPSKAKRHVRRVRLIERLAS